MKPAGLKLILLLTAGAVGLRADTPTPPTAAAEQAPVTPAATTPPISAGTIKETPPSTVAELQPANAPNPDVIELPKMRVQQKKRPRLGEDVMMTNKAFNEKLAKEKTSAFDRNFLNKYGFLGGASAADRAREEYDRAKKDQLTTDVLHLAKVAEVADPAQAKVLRDAVSKP